MDKHKPYGIYEKWFKRPLDCILAIIALIVLSPVMLIIAILVRIKLGSPIIFRKKDRGKMKRYLNYSSFEL